MAGHPGLPWIACAVALLARVYRLTAQSLWVDEIFTLQSIQQVRTADASHLLRDLHGPLFTGLGALCAGFLPGEWLRLLSALAGAAAVLPLHAWTRRLVGERGAALAAFLAALSPFAVWYGQELRNYGFVLLLSALALWAWERWRDDLASPRRLLVFVLVAWLGLLANLTFLLFLVGLGLAMLATAPSGRRLSTVGRLALAAALVLLLTLPWALTFVREMAPQRLVVDMPVWDEQPLRGATTFSPLAIPYTLYTLLAGFSLGPSLAELHHGVGDAMRAHLPLLGLAGGVFALALLLGFLRLPARRRVEFTVIAATVLGLASFLAVKNFKVYNVRYVSMLWPLLVLLAAQGAMGLPDRRRGQALAAALILLFGFALARHYWIPAYGKENVRAATAWVSERTGAEDLIVTAVIGGVFEHYYAGPARIGHLWPGMGPAQMRARLGTWGEPERFTLVSARDWEWDGAENLLRSFEGYRSRQAATFQGVSIYTLNKER